MNLCATREYLLDVTQRYQQSLSRITVVNCHNNTASLGAMVGSAEFFFTFDRILATVVIVVGVLGIWRAEHLFRKLNKRADKLREDFLGSATTTCVLCLVH